MLFHKKIKKERVANAFFSWRKLFPPISCKLYNKVGNKRFLSPRINHSLYSLFLPPFLTSYDHNLPLPPLRHLFPFLFFFFFLVVIFSYGSKKHKNKNFRWERYQRNNLDYGVQESLHGLQGKHVFFPLYFWYYVKKYSQVIITTATIKILADWQLNLLF